MIDLPGLIYEGPPLDEADLAATAPSTELVKLLREKNGFVFLYGGFHVRGICRDPEWHALSTVTHGPRALHQHYRQIQKDDLPFAAECLGDQFFLRGGEVHRLYAESDESEALELGLEDFLERVASQALLELPEFLEKWHAQGQLPADKAIHVYPPFIAANPSGRYNFMPVPRLELLDYHSGLAKVVRDLPKGSQFKIEVQ